MNIVDSIFVYPTDTVWGIGADIFSEKAQTEIAHIKKTETGKPLSVLFGSYEQLKEYVKMPSVGDIDWKHFFQLESTILIPCEHFEKLPAWINYDSPFVGIRVLNNAVTKQIHNLCPNPITSTSLNLKGEDPIVSFDDAVHFKDENCPQSVLINDSSVVPAGHSSTILKFNGLDFTFLREGARIDEIKDALGL